LTPPLLYAYAIGVIAKWGLGMGQWAMGTLDWGQWGFSSWERGKAQCPMPIALLSSAIAQS
ncbi:MAG: hypothetical protein ACR2LR_24200, partial [Hassallia sp.]